MIQTPGGGSPVPIAERSFDGTTDVVTPYGFSGFTGNGEACDLVAGWRRFASEKGYVCGFFTQNPALPGSIRWNAEDLYIHKHIYVLDLHRPLAEVEAKLHTNRRRQLKAWGDIARRLVLDREELTEFLLAHYRHFFQRRNATSVYDLSPQSLLLLSGIDNVVLVGIRDGGSLSAVSMFGYTPHGADFLYNVSLPQGRPYSAALIWYGVMVLHSIGIPHLNLGGGVTEDDGIADFKQRFGSVALPLPYVKQVYDRRTYVQLCRRSGADPDDMTGYFPSYRNP